MVIRVIQAAVVMVAGVLQDIVHQDEAHPETAPQAGAHPVVIPLPDAVHPAEAHPAVILHPDAVHPAEAHPAEKAPAHEAVLPAKKSGPSDKNGRPFFSFF
jgi:hypothetical protein